MRNPLRKRIPRELKANAGKYIGIFIIILCTILLGSSFTAVMDSAMYTLELNEREGKTEDGQFESVLPVSDSVKQYFSEKNITFTENFYTTVNGYEGNARILIFNERKTLNLPTTFKGSLPSKNDEIAVDRLFAENSGIKLGDTLTLNNCNFKVTAMVSFPDYTALFKSNQDLVMNPTDFGVAVVNKDGFDRFEDRSITYRYSYKFDEENLNQKTKRAKNEDIQTMLLKENVSLQSFLTAENNLSISFLKKDLGKDGPIMQAFVYILIAITAFVFMVLTNNMITSESAIIGTLLASGYKRREIVLHYLSVTMIVTLAAVIIGNLLGYTVMLKPFEELYYSSYCVPPLEWRFSYEAFITTSVVPAIIIFAINTTMLYRKLLLSPLQFLRRDLKKGKQKKAIRLPNWSFISRFRLRVILQNKASYLILFSGVFLSSFLLMFGLGMGPLIDNYVDEIDDTLPYEYQYLLKMPVEADGGERLEVYNLETWYGLGEKNINITFMGIKSNSDYFSVDELPSKADEILVTSPMAKKLNVKINDVLTFSDSYNEKEYKLKVAGICDYNSTMGVFMQQENLNKMLGNENDAFNCYVSNEKLELDEKYVLKYITRADMLGAAKQMMKSFDGVIKILNIFSVGLYLILMYILTKTVIEKNTVPISFMKVFGFKNREINKLYLNTTTITVLISLVVCIPLEALSFKAILVYISSLIEGYVEFYIPVWVYAAIIVIGIVTYFTVNSLHIRKIRRIPMSDALKNRE